MDPELGKFKAGSGSGINHFRSTTLLIAHLGHSEESLDHLLTLTYSLGGESGGRDAK